MVWVLASHSLRFWPSKVLDTLISLEMQLDPECLAFTIDPAESMRSVAVHMAEVQWRASIGHEHSHLVHAFRNQTPEIPDHVRTLQVGLRVAFLGVDEIREFLRIADEEHRRVIPSHVPIALLSVELDCESSWVTLRVS